MATPAQRKAAAAALISAMALGGGVLARERAVDLLTDACHPPRAVVEQARGQGGTQIQLDLRRDLGQVQALLGALCPAEPNSSTVADTVTVDLVKGGK